MTGLALTSIIVLQVANLIGRRSREDWGLGGGLLRNRLIVLGIVVEIAFSWSILYFPPLRHVLGTGPVRLEFYLLAWLGVPLFVAADNLQKWLVRKRRNRPEPDDWQHRSSRRAKHVSSRETFNL
jgi:sodium/potassium-transporting ATPase subunit alpha